MSLQERWPFVSKNLFIFSGVEREKVSFNGQRKSRVLMKKPFLLLGLKRMEVRAKITLQS